MSADLKASVKNPPSAVDVDFDDTICDIGVDNVQAALEKLCGGASPGFAFGREGTHNAGTWLICVETPSNKRGIPFGLNNGLLKKVTVSTTNSPSAFTIEVYYHDGNLSGLTLIDTFTTTAAGSTEDFLSTASIPKGHQLAVKISAVGGTKPKETGVFLVITGDLS